MKLEPNNAQWHVNLGIALERQNKWKTAETRYREAVRLAPNDPNALNALGWLLVARGEKLNEALEILTRGVRVAPKNGHILDSLGWAYFKLEQFDEAERYLNEAARRSKSVALIHEHLGDLYKRQDKIETARKAWQKALSLSVDSKEVSRLRGKLGISN